MKHLIIPFILSAGIHLLFFSMDVFRFDKEHFSAYKPSVISMTLVRLKAPVAKIPLPATENEAKPVSIKKPEKKSIKVLKRKLVKSLLKDQETHHKLQEKQEPLEDPQKKQEPLKNPEKQEENFTKPSEINVLIKTDADNPVLTDKIVQKSTSETANKNAEKPVINILNKAMPMYKTNPSPKYPRLARRRGYQGTVVLDVLVDQNGRVGDLRLYESSGHSILDKRAMESVRKWLFEPGMKGDAKIEMWVRVPVRFELK